jgi:hypothetical protein
MHNRRRSPLFVRCHSATTLVPLATADRRCSRAESLPESSRLSIPPGNSLSKFGNELLAGLRSFEG